MRRKTTLITIAVLVTVMLIVPIALSQGVVTSFGSIHISDSLATATPVLQVDNTGSSAILELRDSATPVFQVADGGNADFNNNQALNIGAAGTDFGATGGLTLAQALTVTAGGATITAGGLTVTAGVTNLPVNTENIGLMSIITSTVPYTPATGTVATVADGEIWFVHKVFIKTDTNFDCTGNDCTVTIGDGNDADGFITAADANIQTTFTEATGFTAGYYGIESGSVGAYTTDNGGPFVYAPSGGAETIDYAVGGTSPTAGSATAYVLYTRIQ